MWSRRIWSLSGQSWSVILTTSRGQVLQESNYCRRSFRRQCRNLAKVPSVKNQERSWKHITIQNESPNHRWKITDGRYQCNVHMFYLYEECQARGMHSMIIYDFSCINPVQVTVCCFEQSPRKSWMKCWRLRRRLIRRTYVTRCDFCDSTTHVFSGAWFMIYGNLW